MSLRHLSFPGAPCLGGEVQLGWCFRFCITFMGKKDYIFSCAALPSPRLFLDLQNNLYGVNGQPSRTQPQGGYGSEYTSTYWTLSTTRTAKTCIVPLWGHDVWWGDGRSVDDYYKIVVAAFHPILGWLWATVFLLPLVFRCFVWRFERTVVIVLCR